MQQGSKHTCICALACMQKGAHYVALHTSTHQEITRFTVQGLRWCLMHFRGLHPVSVCVCMIFVPL